jgi:hypothetical protein
MAGQPLRRLLDVAPHGSAWYKRGDETLAIVTTVSEGYWLRIFAGPPAVIGNRLRPDVAGVVELLAQANIPAEAGWEPWRPTGN